MSKKTRYFVAFTPVGWQVRDRETGDERAAFGTGADEYRRARKRADVLNVAERRRESVRL